MTKNRSLPGPVLPCEGQFFLNAKMEIFTPYICENQPWGFGAKAGLSISCFIWDMLPEAPHIASSVAKWFLAASFVNCHIQNMMQQKKSQTKKGI